MGLFRRRIARVAPNRYRVTLPDPERELLAMLLPQLRELLVTDDDSLVRLFPTAYPDDPELDAGYHALVHDELLEKRFASLDVIESTLEATADGVELDEDAMGAWMRATNDLRLVLGTRLDVGEDDDTVPDPDTAEGGLWHVYHYLSALVGWIVDAMADDLPPATRPDD